MSLKKKVLTTFALIALVLVSGCSNPISINKFVPIDDGAYSIGIDKTEDVQAAFIKNDSFLLEVALVEIEDVVVLKLSYTNYSKQPVSIYLNDFFIKDDKLFVQDRISVDYLLSRYGSKYKNIASRDIPSPNRQVVI
ncbi:MAG: hypothetical protein KKC80_03990 [Candidatus Margulisbacteria bacterium]|nr:hypothetical protein [Candidatus Margulisiibacteriota bacterium]MBU1616720.1 hypothetical protein [Candidatus Margulisiibacteriota bacterium]